MSIFGDLRKAGINYNQGSLEISHNLIAENGFATSIGRGNIFYVDSVNGSANNSGKNPRKALATIAQAVAKCTANQGDTIQVLPGHTETISTATGLVVNKAGVTIVGLGSGSLRPTLSLSASASTVSITAANVVLKNLVLISTFTGGVAVGITLSATADGTKLLDIEMQETTNAKEWLIGISVAAACHQVEIAGLRYFGIDGGSTTQAIIFAGASNYSIVRDFFIYGDFSGAAIDALGAASLYMTVARGAVVNIDPTAGLSVSVHASTTGFVHDLRIAQLKDTVGPAGAAMAFSEVYVSNALAAQGILKPAADS